MLRFPSGRSDFQTAEPQFRLLLAAGSIRFSTRSIRQLRPARSGTLQVARRLDCVAPISSLERKLQCAAPESVRALASVRDLQPARERNSTGALDLSPGTSGKSLKDRDLLSGSIDAAGAARCPVTAGSSRRVFLQQTAGDLLAIGKARRRAHTRLCYCSRPRCYPQLVPVPCN